MRKEQEKWSAEEFAVLDLSMKKVAASHELAMAIDRLFFSNSEKDAVRKLKESGQALAKSRDVIHAELRGHWSEALGAQLRESVDRAKKSVGRK